MVGLILLNFIVIHSISSSQRVCFGSNGGRVTISVGACHGHNPLFILIAYIGGKFRAALGGKPLPDLAAKLRLKEDRKEGENIGRF